VAPDGSERRPAWLTEKLQSSALGAQDRPLIGDVAVIEERCLGGRAEQRWREKMGSRE
jgi:hypothetical protein